MRIGIDIDGVLTDVGRFILDYGIRFCYENNIDYNIFNKGYEECSILNISSENALKFWNKYLVEYVTKTPLRSFANDIISKLKEVHEIYIITARDTYGMPPNYPKTIEELTKQWLKDNGIYYDKIYFYCYDKLSICLENKIDIMIEDSPNNIKSVSKQIPTLCFDNPYNTDVCGDKITRVYSWHDILSKITQ